MQNNDRYSGIKTLFTIHNIQYQGQYGFEILEDVFGIPKSEQSLLEYNDCVNLMKGAIESANWVSTVSPTYAKEILIRGSPTSWTRFARARLEAFPHFERH